MNALARTIFPVPVFLKRFAAPRCVLSFGIEGNNTRVSVVCQPESEFEVYLTTWNNHTEEYHDNRKVAQADIIPTLLEYVNKIR